MAVLAELFLVLAGFKSQLTQETQIHAAEADVFNRAAQFGAHVAQVQETASRHYDHPACRVIKREVSQQYLSELALVEADTIAQLADQSAVTLNFDETLLFSSKILSLTVDKWSPLFAFALQILAKIENDEQDERDGYMHTTWIGQQSLENASYPGFRDLAYQILLEVDKTWVSTFKLAVTEGVECPPALLLHRQGPPRALMLEICRSMHQLVESAERSPQIMKSVLTLIEDLDTTIERTKLPLDHLQVTGVCHELQLKIHQVISKHFLRTAEVDAMLQLLRQVILLGSASFTTNLSTFEGDAEQALATYFEIDQELQGTALELGPKLLRASSGRGRAIHILLNTSLQFVFTQDQCTVYESLFIWLSKLAYANNHIAVGAGKVPHAYHLFFNTLWNYYQEQITDAFVRIRSVITDRGGLSVATEQDKVLKKLVSAIFLDSREFRVLLENAFSSCLTDELLPLLTLIENLEGRKHTLDLAPFKSIAQQCN